MKLDENSSLPYRKKPRGRFHSSRLQHFTVLLNHGCFSTIPLTSVADFPGLFSKTL
ncbi:hypothetical protein I79_014849 [Cricetulus griseus]|uniref:Uncharacterized protein n=1 Tax=Cricetulus griseus TaxID=10029 RepID=G3HV72_CRIGR|nr:hypothetical protein I79_014849 [Cricetulus griseus]